MLAPRLKAKYYFDSYSTHAHWPKNSSWMGKPTTIIHRSTNGILHPIPAHPFGGQRWERGVPEVLRSLIIELTPLWARKPPGKLRLDENVQCPVVRLGGGLFKGSISKDRWWSSPPLSVHYKSAKDFLEMESIWCKDDPLFSSTFFWFVLKEGRQGTIR